MARHKDVDWNLRDLDENNALATERIQCALLMDIRDELKQLNTTLGCYRMRRMSDTIERIDRRLAKRISLRRKK